MLRDTGPRIEGKKRRANLRDGLGGSSCGVAGSQSAQITRDSETRVRKDEASDRRRKSEKQEVRGHAKGNKELMKRIKSAYR